MHKANKSNKKKKKKKRKLRKTKRERKNPKLEGKRNSRVRERRLLGCRRGFGCR